MGDTTPDAKSWTSRLGLFMRGGKSRGAPNQQRNGGKEVKRGAKKLSKQQPSRPSTARQAGINELGEYDYGIFSDSLTHAEHADGTKDHTEMLHGLTHRDSSDTMAEMVKGLRDFDDLDPELVALRKKREEMLASVPADVWVLIESYLGPADRAHLALTNKALFAKLGSEALGALNRPENRLDRMECLRHLDRHFPNHLFCFICARYHRRTHPGAEDLTSSYSQNPVFACPAAKTSTLPRTRLAHPRFLPYAFVQLVMRAARYGPSYGIPPERLARGWKDHESGWSHRTTYQIIQGHLVVRVRSQVFAPPGLTPTGMRHLLYERDEYMPYFSACAHWRDGVLMEVCKCALSHVPEPPRSIGDQFKRGPHWAASQVVHGRGVGNPLCRECTFCQSGRRCPLCPSEYLVKLSLVEDRADPVQRFKYAIVVTRWCDLGDGTGPGLSHEWDALNGVANGYNSFQHVGRRAMMGTFESKLSGTVPGVGLQSMNPGKSEMKRDVEWY